MDMDTIVIYCDYAALAAIRGRINANSSIDSKMIQEVFIVICRLHDDGKNVIEGFFPPLSEGDETTNESVRLNYCRAYHAIADQTVHGWLPGEQEYEAEMKRRNKRKKNTPPPPPSNNGNNDSNNNTVNFDRPKLRQNHIYHDAVLNFVLKDFKALHPERNFKKVVIFTDGCGEQYKRKSAPFYLNEIRQKFEFDEIIHIFAVVGTFKGHHDGQGFDLRRALNQLLLVEDHKILTAAQVFLALSEKCEKEPNFMFNIHPKPLESRGFFDILSRKLIYVTTEPHDLDQAKKTEIENIQKFWEPFSKNDDDYPIVYVKDHEVNADDELHKPKDQLGIDGSYCIVCNKDNEKYLKLEGCFCNNACAVSDYDNCRYKNETGEMMIQCTVKEHRDKRTQLTKEKQKRKREQDEQQKDKKQKQQIEKEEEGKTKLLTKYLTRVKSQIDKCNRQVGDCTKKTVARAQKYCSCLAKDHDDIIEKYHPQPAQYIGCDGPFEDLKYSCYKWYHKECVLKWENKQSETELPTKWICPSCTEYKGDEEWFKTKYEEIITKLDKAIVIND